MTNRASMVRSLTPRALKANARSLGSSFASCAAAEAAPSVDVTLATASASRRSRAKSIARFRTDPVEIPFEAMLEGDREDLWKFVGVTGEDRGFDRRVASGPSLDDHRDFLRSFGFPAPVVGGIHKSEERRGGEE